MNENRNPNEPGRKNHRKSHKTAFAENHSRSQTQKLEKRLRNSRQNPEKIKKVADVPVASELSRLNRFERNARLFHQASFRPAMGAYISKTHFGISGMNSALNSDVGDNVSGCSPSCQEYMHT